MVPTSSDGLINLKDDEIYPDLRQTVSSSLRARLETR